jgi:16S rRNA (adenine1518-N6/adenine1519-N6)-dimethyltransferase
VNLTAPSEVAALLRRHGLRPRKRWGQNFLIDRNTLDNVLRAAELAPEDAVLEIGPGLGTLTRELAGRCRRVVAIEIDPLLVGILRSETLADAANVELVHGDALELDLAALLDDGGWKVVANIPYYITTPLIERLISVKERLERIVLMVQREVAARLTAAPGSDDYSSLSVFVQYHTEPELTARVSRGAFLPPPDVDSAIVRLRVRREPPVAVQDEPLMFQVVRAAFQQRRKTLLNALTLLPAVSKEAAGDALERAGIDPSRRGETLSLPEFARLADTLLIHVRASE